MPPSSSLLAVLGDVHGHLQLALGVLARWQEHLGQRFEAVFLCGDVGTFTEESPPDSATHQHARRKPCELEFLRQWSTSPPAPWLRWIFTSLDQGGLGLECPVVMVHGNHEGFGRLAKIVPSSFPASPVALHELPAVDGAGHLRLLPSAWRTFTPAGVTVAGLGGVEEGRYAEYHPFAYVRPDDVERLLGGGPVDLLLTHQGPSAVQGEEHGSTTLQGLLDAQVARLWFHGHSRPFPDVVDVGTTRVVPLGNIPFQEGPSGEWEPGEEGWALVRSGPGGPRAERLTPPVLREFRMDKWKVTPEGLLVCPPLAGLRAGWREGWGRGLGKPRP
jgi:hypothetical protein